MAWEKSGDAYNYEFSPKATSLLGKIRTLAEEDSDPDVRREMSRCFELGLKAILDLVDGRREPTKVLGIQGGADLSDCDSTYVGTGAKAQSNGAPAYRLITREFPPPRPGMLPLLEIVAYGSRAGGRAYGHAAEALDRTGKGPMPEAELFKPIVPHPSAPSTEDDRKPPQNHHAGFGA